MSDVSDDEIVYELGDWTAEERADLGDRLAADGISHRWEGDDVVVAEDDEERVESILDELEDDVVDHSDALPDAADDVDDEAVYAVMSNLYVAADRLKDDPEDPDKITDFCSAADAAATSPPPFGIDPPVWQQVQELAGSLSDEIDADADPDVVATEARSLRQLLSHYV